MPNIFETEILMNRPISSKEDMLATAKFFIGEFLSEKYHCAILCKDDHRLEDANDALYHKGHFHWVESKHIDNPNTHGTGCTLSSAIAANLAKDYSIEDAIKRAKQYISGALAAMLNLGQGNGPIHHGFDLKSKYIT